MTPEQQREIRLGVLRVLLHPASDFAELLEGLPAHEIRACIDEINSTLKARIRLLERAKRRKGIFEQ
jgi:hypothetical protein